MKYYLGTGAEVTAAKEISHHSSEFLQDILPVGQCEPSEHFNGGAVVSADDGVTPLGVSVAVYYSGTTSPDAMFFSLNGVPAGAAKVYRAKFIPQDGWL